MADLIVLGLVPGTHIQISFIFWITLISIVAIATLLLIGYPQRMVRNWLVTIEFMVLTRRHFRA